MPAAWLLIVDRAVSVTLEKRAAEDAAAIGPMYEYWWM